jgi:hypothetical protein
VAINTIVQLILANSFVLIALDRAESRLQPSADLPRPNSIRRSFLMRPSESGGLSRRRFAAAGLAAAGALIVPDKLFAERSQPSSGKDLPKIKPATNTSFATLKQINAGLLNVGYAEAGPANGAPVILLHGWPYDIYSFVDVAPLLAAAGYRVIVPYLRGYGTTTFLSGGADGRHHGRTLAGTLQSARLGKWLSHRQPGRGQSSFASCG